MARREAPTRAPEHPSQNLPISPTSRTPPVDPSRIRNPILEHPTNSQKASTWEREDGAGGFWAGFGGLVRLRFLSNPDHVWGRSGFAFVLDSLGIGAQNHFGAGEAAPR